MLASAIIFEWISAIEAVKTKIKYHQPRKLIIYVCTLLAQMKDKHDWGFSFDKVFNFEGELVPKLTGLFADRRKECDDAYDEEQAATVINRPARAPDDNGYSNTALGTLDLSCFDESDPIQLMYKLMLCCGAYLGFSGIQEHADLCRNNLMREFFEVGHLCEGEEFWGIRNMESKTNHLSASNPVVKSHNGMRIPVQSNCGQFLNRYVEKLSPHQDCLYILLPCQSFSD